MRQRLLNFGQWAALGSLVGLLSGAASALFLHMLETVTQYRQGHPAVVWGLPLAGLLMGWVYAAFGRELMQGNNLVLDRLHDGGPQLPLRMAPMVMLGTVWTHLFGGSAGREGTGVQMGASLADAASGWLKLGAEQRRHMLAAGVAAGFGSVFGTPLAGTLFGMEVVSAGRMDYGALLPALIAALVGHQVTLALGIEHAAYTQPLPEILTPLLTAKWIAFGAAVAAVGWLFIESSHWLKARAAEWMPALHWRLALGGLLLVLLWQLPGTDPYLGLSTPLIRRALEGGDLPAWAFAAKLLFTVVTLGFGFIGGEVTPLFVIGACLGTALAAWLGLPPALAAGVGMAALFGACANTPLAVTVMAVELLGAALLPHVAVVVIAAYLLIGARSLYPSQRLGTPKA
jgi:H+/Cl- antiporter ClcA